MHRSSQHFLQAPVPLDQIRSIAREPSRHAQAAKVPQRPAAAHGVLEEHPGLAVQDPEDEEGAQRGGQRAAVGAVELGEGGEQQREGHALDVVAVGAAGDVERVGGGVGRGARGAGGVAEVLLAAEALADDAQREEGEVGGEGEGEGARHG